MTLPISAAARCAAVCVLLALAGTAKGQLVTYTFESMAGSPGGTGGGPDFINTTFVTSGSGTPVTAGQGTNPLALAPDAKATGNSGNPAAGYKASKFGGALDVNGNVDLTASYLQFSFQAAQALSITSFTFDFTVGSGQAATQFRPAVSVGNTTSFAFIGAQASPTPGVWTTQVYNFAPIPVAAGQTVYFRLYGVDPTKSNPDITFDNFNVYPVPEPSGIAAAALVVMGGLYWVVRRRLGGGEEPAAEAPSQE